MLNLQFSLSEKYAYLQNFFLASSGTYSKLQSWPLQYFKLFEYLSPLQFKEIQNKTIDVELLILWSNDTSSQVLMRCVIAIQYSSS